RPDGFGLGQGGFSQELNVWRGGPRRRRGRPEYARLGRALVGIVRRHGLRNASAKPTGVWRRPDERARRDRRPDWGVHSGHDASALTVTALPFRPRDVYQR